MNTHIETTFRSQNKILLFELETRNVGLLIPVYITSKIFSLFKLSTNNYLVPVNP